MEGVLAVGALLNAAVVAAILLELERPLAPRAVIDPGLGVVRQYFGDPRLLLLGPQHPAAADVFGAALIAEVRNSRWLGGLQQSEPRRSVLSPYQRRVQETVEVLLKHGDVRWLREGPPLVLLPVPIPTTGAAFGSASARRPAQRIERHPQSVEEIEHHIPKLQRRVPIHSRTVVPIRHVLAVRRPPIDPRHSPVRGMNLVPPHVSPHGVLGPAHP
mmetsp:Transcript_50088/g.150769  ORF Transcript_50088/g.150769 Transcript_50088/m.150769 type:complete len:216 (+) Transcript_50088:700-1347(+)